MAMDTTIRSTEEELQKLKMYIESQLEANYLESVELEWNSSMNNAKRIGMEEGLKEGLEQGLEQGLEKGIKATAFNMLREGADISFIRKVTGLSEETIQSLKQPD